MNQLPIEIVIYFTPFVISQEIFALYCSGKRFSCLFDIYKKTRKKEWVLDVFDDTIINLMGGLNQMMSYPIIKCIPRFIGGTDYIDNILPSDVSDKIMLGVDIYNRAFITFCMKNDDDIFVDTLFQRYTGNKTSWTHGYKRHTFVCESGMIVSRGTIYHELTGKNIENLLHDAGFIYKFSEADDSEYDRCENYCLWNPR